jgi:endoglucanase Acf2
MKLCSGSELSWSSPLSEPKASLDLGTISTAQRKELSAQVKKDAAALPAFPADSYFGGKAIYRAAMLYQLALQLDAEQPAAELKAKLAESLGQWTDPQGCAKRQAFCFVYDERAKGVVGITPSFGSEEFNDHHFHYGYFLYAAGVLAANDPALARQYAPVMNLLAADIGSSANGGKASAGSRTDFPDRRTFDAYAGHSWALGHRTVRGRQQPGVKLRSGHSMDRARALGSSERQSQLGNRGDVAALQRGTSGPGLLDQL